LPPTTTSTTTTAVPTPTSVAPTTEPEVVIPEEITDEQLAEVLTALESDDVSEEQVAAAVDQILAGEVSPSQATDLATSAKVLESIDTTQAAEIFAQIPVGELTAEQEAELVAAVSDAPTEIKNTFEATIDVYGGGLDEYVPVGSQIDVGGRRTLIAATTAVSTIAAGAGAAATSGSSSGGGSSSSRDRDDRSGGSPSTRMTDLEMERIARRQARKMITGKSSARNFNNQITNGTKMVKMTPQRILSLIVKEISALSFTLAGSVIVLFTLSGQTRKIALIATGVAIILHFANAFSELKKSSVDFRPMSEDTSIGD